MRAALGAINVHRRQESASSAAKFRSEGRDPPCPWLDRLQPTRAQHGIELRQLLIDQAVQLRTVLLHLTRENRLHLALLRSRREIARRNAARDVRKLPADAHGISHLVLAPTRQAQIDDLLLERDE